MRGTRPSSRLDEPCAGRTRSALLPRCRQEVRRERAGVEDRCDTAGRLRRQAAGDLGAGADDALGALPEVDERDRDDAVVQNDREVLPRAALLAAPGERTRERGELRLTAGREVERDAWLARDLVDRSARPRDLSI